LTSRSEARRRAAIYEHYGLTCPPRYATLRNFDNPTYGGKVARIAKALGTPLMPWQRYAADTALEIDPETGIFVYRKVGVTVPRQSGKTSLGLPVCCHRGLAWQRQRITYAAQNGTAARQKWEDDQLPILEAAGFIPREGERLLPKHRARVRKANGREAIIWRKNRSIHGLHANTERAGHGPTLHLGMLDEYFAQVDQRVWAAWNPAMITQEMAQSWWLSTQGTSASVPMNEDIELGRELVEAGEPSRYCYIEFSAPAGADRSDRDVWLSCMPALCPDPPCRCSPHWRHTVTLGAIAAELELANTPAKLAEYDRAYMNIKRDDDAVAVDPQLPTLAEFDLLANAAAERGSAMACGIDVSPMATSAAIVAVGEGPDGVPLEVVLEHHPGIAWVVPRAVELHEQLRPVAWVLDQRSRTRDLLEPLRQAGITEPESEQKRARGDLWLPTTQDIGAGCGAWCTAVKTGKLAHLGQEALRDALANAKVRPLGDGMFAFGRKASSEDITTLVAGAEALAAFEKWRHLAFDDYDLLDSIA